MTTYTLTVRPAELNERQIGARLFFKFLGPKRRALFPLSLILPWVVGAVLVHQFTDLNMLRTEVMVSVLLFYVSIACWLFTSGRLGRLADAAVDATPIRQRPTAWTLNAAGIQGDGWHLDWADVQAVHQFSKMTVLQITLRRVVAFPDSRLPQGVTPATFLAQINTWRGA
jgi:hypothetical protein